MLSTQIDAIIPSCRVDDGLFVRFKAWDSRPTPGVQNATSIDEYVAFIEEALVLHDVLDLDNPFGTIIVPLGTDDDVL